MHCFAIFMHLPTIRFTVPINTTLPYECVIVPHVPYCYLNTGKRDKRMTTIPFNLHQPMLIYASAKMLSETVAFPFTHEIGQKQRIYLLFYVSVGVQKNLFVDIIKQVGTCPRSNNNNSVLVTLHTLSPLFDSPSAQSLTKNFIIEPLVQFQLFDSIPGFFPQTREFLNQKTQSSPLVD